MTTSVSEDSAERYRRLAKERDQIVRRQKALAQDLRVATFEIVELARRELSAAEAELQEIADDPKFRPDKSCALCTNWLPAKSIEQRDPFCSTECAKIWHHRTARKLGLFPAQATLIKPGDTPFMVTARELLWIVNEAAPRMNRPRKARQAVETVTEDEG